MLGGASTPRYQAHNIQSAAPIRHSIADRILLVVVEVHGIIVDSTYHTVATVSVRKQKRPPNDIHEFTVLPGGTRP